MGTELIDPQAIRNVTVVGEPDDTTRVVHRLRRALTTTVPPARTTGHTIRFAELSTHAPIDTLERSIRLADGVLAVMNATRSTARLEAALRVADDHQVARLCLVTGLDQPGADFDRCVHTIAGTHGAVPLVLHIPHGLGAHFDGVVDLIPMWAIEPVAAAYYGRRWELAEQWYHAAAGDDHAFRRRLDRCRCRRRFHRKYCMTASAVSPRSVTPCPCCVMRRREARSRRW